MYIADGRQSSWTGHCQGECRLRATGQDHLGVTDGIPARDRGCLEIHTGKESTSRVIVNLEGRGGSCGRGGIDKEGLVARGRVAGRLRGRIYARCPAQEMAEAQGESAGMAVGRGSG